MNKWLALYAVLCITIIIALVNLGWEYETAGYGLHPVIAAMCVISVGISYWCITKAFNSKIAKAQYDNHIANIINDARKDKRYLNNLTNHKYLCTLILHRSLENRVTPEDSVAANKVIAASIGGNLFLITHLRKLGKIPVETEWKDVAYYVAAHAFWDELVDKLKGRA